MESLCNCPELQSLALHNCGLLAVEGLEKCTEMQELYLEVSDFLQAIIGSQSYTVSLEFSSGQFGALCHSGSCCHQMKLKGR